MCPRKESNPYLLLRTEPLYPLSYEGKDVSLTLSWYHLHDIFSTRYMSRLIIKGGRKLEGIWPLSGNKNEALPLVAASLLFNNNLILKNLPMLEDVKVMMAIAKSLGVSIKSSSDRHIFNTTGNVAKSIPSDFSAKVRGSLLFLSPLLLLNGRADIPSSGGDKIGLRKIDHHLEVFRAFGCKIIRDKIIADQQVLNSGREIKIWLSEPSVTATEGAMLLASRTRGTTIIKNAACEPHVIGLGKVLQDAGAIITGLGTNLISIKGLSRFKRVEHTIGDDFMEMGSVLTLSAIFNNNIKIPIKKISEYEKIFEMMEKFGKRVIFDNKIIKVANIKGREDTQIEEISSQPWPSFPSDLMSVFIVLATQTNGQYLFHEKMFESRLYFTDQLKSLGAKLVLCDPHRVLVIGSSILRGVKLVSPDIRAGMALVIAALVAKGESIIDNAEQLDRGYENIVGKLINIGADIKKEG